MSKVKFPQQLEALLRESPLQPGIRALADRTGEILADNKLTFFPDYTDHGVEHINRVLDTQVELVPSELWDQCIPKTNRKLLGAADAAVIIGATLLHDLAMHLTVPGFRELISLNSRFAPVEWFAEDREDHRADRPWLELWLDYERDARRLSERELTDIVGDESARSWKFDGLPTASGEWTKNHCLIVGEFIRRHHARLAHEIALYGFPGVPAGAATGEFPAIGQSGHMLHDLADLIGLTARSHWTSLRLCKAYLDDHHFHGGALRPSGCAVLYPMALLRVADYLQLDHTRAPAVLLQLREPQSPISVMEWAKHKAVRSIGRHKDDRRAKIVTVSEGITLRVYLQLRDLINGLQREMDHSTAVLDEVYGEKTEEGLHLLQLATRRVYSNLQTPSFRKRLPYVPSATGFSADPHILTLLVEPLYGKYPGVGVRELMQNAVDAVRELETWCKNHDKTRADLDLPKLANDADVLIDYIKRDDGTWFLQITDRGIGMTADTIQNYFLRAGASFRRSKEWAKENIDEHGKPKVLRSGRFGIGAFAVFLLGKSFKLQTRHATAPKSEGYALEASENSTLIQLSRKSTDFVGTQIEVELSECAVRSLDLETAKGIPPLANWFDWCHPKLVHRISKAGAWVAGQSADRVPVDDLESHPKWSAIHPQGFDAVYWTFDSQARMSCNGIRVASPKLVNADFWWDEDTLQLSAPRIAIVDSSGMLPLSTQRYALSDSRLPFTTELERDAVFSFVAQALVWGPTSRSQINVLGHPLVREHRYTIGGHRSFNEIDTPTLNGGLRWCATHSHFIPADALLFQYLGASHYLLIGRFGFGFGSRGASSLNLLDDAIPEECALICWELSLEGSGFEERSALHIQTRIIENIVKQGVKALHSGVRAARVRVSSDEAIPFTGYGIEIRDDKDTEVELALAELNSDLILKEIFDQARRYLNAGKDTVFLGEFEPIITAVPRPTLIAQIWTECLGKRAIPFNPVERQAMIEHGCEHPELKRHIEAWQKLKAGGWSPF